MILDLTGKRAIVCGSSGGIGKASAVLLSQLGACITLIARDEKRLQVALSELPRKHGQSHDYIVADFNDPKILEKKVSYYLNSHGPVHILVNNTGGPPPGAAIDSDSTAFLNAFSCHLVCGHILVKAVVEGMKSEKYGRIINILSTSAKEPIPGLGISNAIRGAMAGWAKTLAGELGQHGITVNNVLPGYTATSRLESLWKHKAAKTGKKLEDLRQTTIASIPLGRLARPEEIASAVAFLASPAASYINGINLPVDGGRLGCL